MATRQTAYLGIDVGTSGLKIALLGADGQLLASAEDAYAVSAPEPGWAESDPSVWTSALTAAVTRTGAELAAVDVAGIGVAGQMHGAVLCDSSGIAIAPAILWPDRRAEAELERWRRLSPAQLRTLANPLAPGMTGPMVAWLAAHRPDLLSRASVVLHAKDVVRTALVDQSATPAAVSDRSDASATLLWDVAGERWAVDVCDAVGMPTHLLPAVVRSSEVVGQSAWLGRAVDGASLDVPVVAGAGDTPAAIAAVAPEGLQINFGTGVQMLIRQESATHTGADQSIHLYADAGDSWYAMVALLNGGLALEWAADVLELTWESLIASAARGRIGAVSFLPFLTGERGGVASPTSHGGWLGLSADTTRDDLARAAVEGVVFAVRRGVELLGDAAAAGSPVVTLSGGGWRTPLLCQLTADVLGRPVRRVNVRSASASGAAMLAAAAVGADLQPVRSTDPVIEPSASPALEAAYQRWRDRCAAAAS